MKRIAIYAFHHPQGEVPEYVLYKLERLREHVGELVVVCSGAVTPSGRASLERVADVVHVRETRGFDTWAYRCGMGDVVGWEKLASFDEVLLVDSSFYGPLFPFSELFRRMDALDVDCWGITAVNGPAANSPPGDRAVPDHVHSSFLAIRRRLVSAPEFRRYWDELPALDTAREAMHEHERRFTAHFRNLGFRVGVYSEEGIPAVADPLMEIPDVLLANRCPILPRRLFLEDSARLHGRNVELRRALDVIERSSEYPTSLVWHDLVPAAKPRDLYTNTTLIDVLPTDGSPAPPTPPPSIAVLAHVFYPEMLDEMATYWSHIPIAYDLHITTPTEDKKRLLEEQLAGRRQPPGGRVEIRVVSNRGRDMSAWLVGQRDIILDGRYDLICRVHSKRSPQIRFAAARHFKEHLLENLLASTPYVTRLLQLFADEPCLGIVMPPVVHIGGDIGDGWFGNRPGAESLAAALKITVPFDDHTPLAAYGSMFWARTSALRALVEHGFSWADFPDRSSYFDGDMPHVLERLVVYAPHQAGFYAKCAMTPANTTSSWNNACRKSGPMPSRDPSRSSAATFRGCSSSVISTGDWLPTRCPAGSPRCSTVPPGAFPVSRDRRHEGARRCPACPE